MPDHKLFIFICRAQARRDIAALSETGEAEIARVALRSKRFELSSENCDILTSPTDGEKETAKSFARHLGLGDPIEIPWLNEPDVQGYIIANGFLRFSEKAKLVIIIEKPVLVKIAAFCEQPSHDLHSGDTFILRYPGGRLERLR